MAKLEFPKGFLWGAATSSHQVEGNNHNDWSEWEKANANRLADEASRKNIHNPSPYEGEGPADSGRVRFDSPLNPQNYISGRACDHYNRFREDFDIAKSLNHNAHRFSIEWSRIEPEEGKWDEKEIEHYREVVRAIRERGMEPFVTLWHWTLPLWVAKQGRWENKKTISDFTRYTEKITASLQGVKYYITLNEPEIYATNSYLRGKWPPQKNSFLTSSKVMMHLISGHKKAYSAIKNINPEAKIGASKNNSYFEGWPAFAANWWWNRSFLDHIKNYQDFIGLNYYFHNKIKGFNLNQNENKLISDMGTEIYPEGIYHVLKELRKYSKPVYITENGTADSKDEHRNNFIQDHLRWTHKAISEGVDVRGYFHWSLLDNFEWDKGFWPRFGLVEIDYETMERRPRQSAYFYATVAKENSLEV